MASQAHQYTIRNIPPALHRRLRAKAADRGISVNALALMALEAEAGLSPTPRLNRDFDDLFGSWVADKAVDRALAEQRTVDPRDWK